MNILKRLAVLVVTAYAKRTYETTMNEAENRRRREGRQIFAIPQQYGRHRRRIVLLTYAEYRDVRRQFRLDTLDCSFGKLKATCWYYSADRFGRNGMSKRQIEVRKRAFIRDTLLAAGLIVPNKIEG